MFPGLYAARRPEKAAAVKAGSGESITYFDLEERSCRLANVLVGAGLVRGDAIAMLSDNDLRVFEVYWAAMRSGLYITVVNHHLTADEVAYIVNDSGAGAFIASATKADVAGAIVPDTPEVRLRLSFGGSVDGHRSYEEELASASGEPRQDQPHGATMLYSSGTTGRPKGVRPPLPATQVTEPGDVLVGLVGSFFGVTEDAVYLNPAPIYHAAPLRWCAAIQAHGGTVVMTDRFDAEQTLEAISAHGITHAQFVPTMFVRMLTLPAEVRDSYDISTLTVAVHAAAPCPVEVKHRMIDWWGPILVEYYAATEGYGMTMIDSRTWQTKEGSVGRPVMGVVHICDDLGREVPSGEIGTLWFEREEVPFVYHNDQEKTAAAQHPDHPTWTTVGDIGYVDEDGFLFLTDRKSFVIISGGVNIYPQEIENLLALHPAVHDVAVIGLPDQEMGEVVTAFVEPSRDAVPGADLEQEIIGFVRSRLARFKAPRTVRFIDDLPRTDTGKLVKGELRRTYAR